jgi:hypothetical protein
MAVAVGNWRASISPRRRTISAPIQLQIRRIAPARVQTHSEDSIGERRTKAHIKNPVIPAKAGAHFRHGSRPSRLSGNRRVPWISVVRPSRRPLRGLLRMRSFLNAINGLPHAEERPRGRVSKHAAPRCSSSFCASVNFLTASFAGKTRRGISLNHPNASKHQPIRRAQPGHPALQRFPRGAVVQPLFAEPATRPLGSGRSGRLPQPRSAPGHPRAVR